IPSDVERFAALHRSPGIRCDDHDSTCAEGALIDRVDREDVSDAGNSLRLTRVELRRLTPEDRAPCDHCVNQTSAPRVDAALCSAAGLRACFVTIAVVTNDREIARIL